MSEETVYPAIYKAVDGNVFLYADKENYYSFERGCWDVSGEDDNHANDKNITRESLNNTYGEVVSPEHAEFIVELAKVNGFSIPCAFSVLNRHFNFYEGNLYFWDGEDASKGRNEKQITIPLPPKSTPVSKVNRDIERAVKAKINDELDQVKSPSHYQLIEGVESIEIIARSMTVEQWHGFCLGNMLKYRLRYGKKHSKVGCRDIEKADYYEVLYKKYRGACHSNKRV